jgi:hypothetical protein
METDTNFIEYLKRYDVKYDKKNSKKLFEKLIIANDIEQLIKLEKIINDPINFFPSIRPILKKANSEMIKCVLTSLKLYGYSGALLRILASRHDDNLEIFEYCAKIVRFPEEYYSFDHYEDRCGEVIHDVLLASIKKGNYRIFNYIVTVGNLASKHKRTLDDVAVSILNAKYFNHKILDDLVFRFEGLIDYQKIKQLISKGNKSVLEHVIELMQTRKIIISNNDLDQLIDYADNEYPDASNLFDSIRP